MSGFVSELSHRVAGLPAVALVLFFVIMPVFAFRIVSRNFGSRGLMTRVMFAILGAVSATFIALAAVLHDGTIALILALAGFTISFLPDIIDRILRIKK